MQIVSIENGVNTIGRGIVNIQIAKMLRFLKGVHIRGVARWLIQKAITAAQLRGWEHCQQHRHSFMSKLVVF